MTANSLLKNPIFVILSEAKDLISVGDSSAFGLRMTQLGFFQQTANSIVYILLVSFFTLSIRVIPCLFKAWAICNGEAEEKENNKPLFIRGFKKISLGSLLSNGKDIRIDDYWLPAIIGGINNISCFDVKKLMDLYRCLDRNKNSEFMGRMAENENRL